MPRRGGRHKVLVKGAEHAMEAFKLEVAQDLGLARLIDKDGSYKNMTTVQVGQIGGEMVRRIQAAGEFAIMNRYNNHEERLMPEEVLPKKEDVQEMTNNGNITVHLKDREGLEHTPGSGQQFPEGNLDEHNNPHMPH